MKNTQGGAKPGENPRPGNFKLKTQQNPKQSTDKEPMESNEHYQQIVDIFSDSVFVHVGGIVVFANPAMVKLMGADSMDQLIGMTALDIVHPDCRDRVTKIRNNIIRTAQPIDLQDFRFVSLGGKVIDVDAACAPIQWNGKDAISIVARDVTERKQAEKEIAEKSALLESTFESMEQAFCVFDGKAHLIAFNQRYVELYRFPPGFVRLGMDHEEIIRKLAEQGLLGDGDVDEMVAKRVASAMASEERTNENTLPDGTSHIYHRRPMPKGGFVATFTDITDRKMMEQALRDSEEHFRNAIEASAAGISLVHLNSSQRHYNHALTEMLGYSMEELSQIHLRDLVAEETKAQHRLERDQIIAGKIAHFQEEVCYIRKDGRLVWALVSQSLIRDSDNQPLSVLSMFQDITARKTAEEQLHQAQKMEAVGQLTGGVAHDFNNLLMIIQGNLELIASKSEDPALDRMLKNAIKASERGAELTQRLLAFSRKQTLLPNVIEPINLVSGMVDLMRRSLGETIEIEVIGDGDLWRSEVDIGQLESAILNLALNARDAMPQGGKLTIKTTNAKLEDSDIAVRNNVSTGDYVKITVSDTGTGMAQNVIDHVFEPFFTTKEVGAGSGLGLSMVHGFISQSGGFVTIDSTEGVGSSVNLYLPRSVETCAPAPQPAKKKDPLSRGEKILVVEDDSDVRELTVSLLDNLGYDTVEAANGKEAIEALQQTTGIDLLFSDVILSGGMSGLDIAEEASKLIPNIKVLLTSGYPETVLDQSELLEQQYQLIKKPFKKAILARQIRDILDHTTH